MIKIKLYGLGGQGVVTASKILTHAVVINENRFGRSLPAYGAERRGAPIFADVMVDDVDIHLTSFVYAPDMVVVFDPSVINKGMDIFSGVHPATELILNTSSPKVIDKYCSSVPWKKVYSIDAQKITLDTIGKDIPNSAMLGAVAFAGIVTIESIKKSLLEIFGKKAGELNVQAAEIAYAQTKQIRAGG